MKKIAFILVAGIVLHLFVGCISEKLDIDIPVVHLSHKQSNVFSHIDMKYIQLETTNNNRIGVVEQLQSYGDIIYVLDGSLGGGVFCFDQNGTFIAKFGNMGRGPGEYVMPTSFSIDSEKNIITVLDVASERMLSYDLSTAEFMYASDSPVSSGAFEYLTSDATFWNVDEYETGEISNYQYAIVDSNGNVSKMLLDKMIKSGYLTGPSKMMYRLDDTLRFYTQFNPYLYKLDNEQMKKAYYFQMDGIQFAPTDFLRRISANNRDYYDELVKSDYISYHEILENEDNICVTYIANSIKYIGIYNKLSGETICGNIDQIEDGIGIKGLTYVSGKIGDYFVIPIFSEMSKVHQEEGHSYPPELTEILNNSQDGDNPILLLFRLK